MGLIVAKFGGSSLADARQMRKVRDIVLSHPDRRFIVPSAPGKRFADDSKVTDLLYDLHHAVEYGLAPQAVFAQICSRYEGICNDLSLSLNIRGELEQIYDHLLAGASRDYAASRGEYLNGLILAEYIGYDFVDAADVIRFDVRGKYDAAATQSLMRAALAEHARAVIPGFYGSMPGGGVKTFSRGGSDITGAIVAAAVDADLYENWTDVSGFMMADPRIVPNVRKIDRITYRELRELSYMGATVLHEDAIFPVYQAAIPINVRNTNEPAGEGTMILPTIDDEDGAQGITGVAGKKGFSVISIEKNGMNAELGFGRRVLACIEKYSVPFEHMPSGIDTLCVVLEDSRIQDTLGDIVDDIHRTCEPDSVEVIGHMALIATVGRGMIKNIGSAARLLTALARAGVNVRMIDQGSSELNIIVGVESMDFERAVNAIYQAFTLGGN